MLNTLKPYIKKYFDIWASQGRTEEQKWSVMNFLTGQGELMIKEAEENGRIKEWSKHVKP